MYLQEISHKCPDSPKITFALIIILVKDFNLTLFNVMALRIIVLLIPMTLSLLLSLR